MPILIKTVVVVKMVPPDPLHTHGYFLEPSLQSPTKLPLHLESNPLPKVKDCNFDILTYLSSTTGEANSELLLEQILVPSLYYNYWTPLCSNKKLSNKGYARFNYLITEGWVEEVRKIPRYFYWPTQKTLNVVLDRLKQKGFI